MKIYFTDICFGEIIEEGEDFPWKIGTFIPNEEAEKFRDFFTFMVDENQNSQDPPFPPDLLDEANWFIEDDNNHKRQISIPAIEPDNSICWIWYSE